MRKRKERREFEQRMKDLNLDLQTMLQQGEITLKECAELLQVSRTSNFMQELSKDLTLPKTILKSRRFDYLYSLNKNYWETKELVEYIKLKLKKPIINKSSETNKRYVISFKNHPRASKIHQVKAHIIVWEIENKQYLPKDYGIWFKDRNQLNISTKNLEALSLSEIKSRLISMEKNNFWKGGNSKYNNYLHGWKRISRIKIAKDKQCKVCKNSTDLLIHHIVPYSVFNNKQTAHKDENLLTVCRRCHGQIHYNKINSWRHIDEIQYEKLLKLLEHLKSQSSDIDLETIQLIEQQIEQTDNQQPSSSAFKDGGEGPETISKESKTQEGLKKEDANEISRKIEYDLYFN